MGFANETDCAFPRIFKKADRHPIKLLCLVLLLHPLWWLLGLDQIVLAVAAPLILIVGVITRVIRLKGYFLHFALFFFIFCHLLSGINVLTGSNISFYGPLYVYRTLLALSGPCVFLIVADSCRGSEDANILVKTIILLLIISIITSFIGYLLLFFNGPSNFSTAFNYIAPESIKQFGVIRSWFVKSIINKVHIFESISYRHMGLFKYPNMLAFIMSSGILFSIYFFITFKRKMYLLIAVIIFLALLLTTSRGGILTCVFGITLLWALLMKRPVVLVGFGIVLLCLVLFHETGYEFRFTPQEVGREAVAAISDLREGSTKGRTIIYKKTLEHILRKPFVGWGTYRQIPGKSGWPYLGSHGTFFSILFRLGLLGTIAFILLMIAIIKNLNDFRKAEKSNCDKRLAKVVLAVVCVQILHMIILDIHDDLYVISITWAIWAIGPGLAGARRLSQIK